MNKSVLITGASKGIGKELAIIFAQNGYSLLLLGREMDELEQLQKDLENKYHCSVKIFSVDFNNPESIDIIMNTFQDDIDKLDVFVNNAGLGLLKKFTDMPQEELASILTVNIVMHTQLLYRILSVMKAKKSGKILNVGSIAGLMPGPYMSVYYASKAYVVSLSKALRREFKNDGIHISALCPGVTQTAFLYRAQMDKSLILSGIVPIMSAEKVASIAYRGLMRNKGIIIPGVMNKVSVFLAWLMPTFIVTKVLSLLQKPRS